MKMIPFRMKSKAGLLRRVWPWGAPLLSALLWTACGGNEKVLLLEVNGLSNKDPEFSQYAGTLPVRTDCGLDYCINQYQEVSFALVGCTECSSTAWSIRNPMGEEVKRGTGSQWRFTPGETGTWLVSADYDNSIIAHFLIVQPGAVEPIPELDEPNEDLPSNADNKSKTSVQLARVAAAPEVLAPQGQPATPSGSTPARPIMTDLAQLDLKAGQLRLQGLEDEEYRIYYTHNTEEKSLRMKARNGVILWPDRFESGRSHDIRIDRIERIKDGQTAALLLNLEFGEEAVAAPKTTTTKSKTAEYSGKTTRSGRTAPSTAPDCAADWVVRAEMHLEAEALCRAEYGWLWADQAGDLIVTLKDNEGTRSITKRLAKGKNQITFGNLHPEWASGEKAVLILEAKGVSRMANLAACPIGNSPEQPLKVRYQDGRICLTDMLIQY